MAQLRQFILLATLFFSAHAVLNLPEKVGGSKIPTDPWSAHSPCINVGGFQPEEPYLSQTQDVGKLKPNQTGKKKTVTICHHHHSETTNFDESVCETLLCLRASYAGTSFRVAGPNWS